MLHSIAQAIELLRQLTKFINQPR